MPHRADLLLVNVGRARLQLDPVIFQRAERVVQDERGGAVVLLVLLTGIVDDGTNDAECLIGVGGYWPIARGAFRHDLPAALGAVVLGDGGDGLLFPRIESCGHVALNLGLAAVLQFAWTPHVSVGDLAQHHLGCFVCLLHVARGSIPSRIFCEMRCVFLRPSCSVSCPYGPIVKQTALPLMRP